MEQIEASKRSTKEGLEQRSEVTQVISSLSAKDVSRSGSVLIVDDNEMNRDMLSRRLHRQGHTVTIAVNGREALDMIKAQDFDLILLDIMMPELNGYEVLEQLKANSSLQHIPVIMITAVDEIESIVRCIELGAEDYLPKPFNPVLLKARINASLEKKWLRDQREAHLAQLDLENKRKSNELEQARQIQLSMLPTSPPQLSFLDIAARQKTASEVGGDYYDFFPQADGSLLVAFGDATGHGVGPGLMVSMTKASLLAMNEADLNIMLDKINTILTQIDLSSQLNMALLLLQVFRLPDGSIAGWASGGGVPPIYILRAAGPTEEVLISGLPLGAVETATYTSVEFTLHPGDVVLLMSDGLPEMFNTSRELLGFERLESTLEQLNTTHLTAEEILEAVANIGEAWALGRPLHDDVTLVVMKVK